MKPIKSCGVLIVRGQPIESFLLMKHLNRWDLPKGHVDPGETDIECALRELHEETGISAADIELDPDFRFVHQYIVHYDKPRKGGTDFEKTLVIFLGRLKSDIDIQITEHAGFQWFDWNPPHQIQRQTIDPLLSELHDFLK